MSLLGGGYGPQICIARRLLGDCSAIARRLLGRLLKLQKSLPLSHFWAKFRLFDDCLADPLAIQRCKKSLHLSRFLTKSMLLFDCWTIACSMVVSMNLQYLSHFLTNFQLPSDCFAIARAIPRHINIANISDPSRISGHISVARRLLSDCSTIVCPMVAHSDLMTPLAFLDKFRFLGDCLATVR